MKRYLPFIIIATVAVLAIGGGAMFYRAMPHARSEGALANTSADKLGAHVRGKSDALVTVEEFGDFQCPPCGTVAGILGRLEKEYGSRLRVIFREFPLTMHPHAFEAAMAAEAAGLQGRFWEMHDLLYERQSDWSKATEVRPLFLEYARTLQLNVERFGKELESEAARARVIADHDRGVSRGVKNTPTIFINDREVRMIFTFEAFHDAIESAITGDKKS